MMARGDGAAPRLAGVNCVRPHGWSACALSALLSGGCQREVMTLPVTSFAPDASIAADAQAVVAVDAPVTVSPTGDAGLVPGQEGRSLGSEAKQPPGTQVCAQNWKQPAGTSISSAQLAVDAAGGIFLAVNYVLTIPNNPGLNLGAVSATLRNGLAIAKLDGECSVEWVKQLGTPGSGTLESAAIATDSASNVTVLGTFDGTVDLGAGPVDAGSPSAQGAFLLRLDASGQTVFSKPFLSQQTNAFETDDVAVSPNGTSTIALAAGRDTDFGGGPDAVTGSRFYLVRFDPSGRFIFRKDLATIDSALTSVPHLITDDTGTIWATASNLRGGTTNLLQAVLKVSPSGVEQWIQHIQPPSASPPIAFSDILQLAVNTSGQAVVQSEWSDTTYNQPPGPSMEKLWAFATDGTPVWSYSNDDYPSGGILPLLVSEGIDGNPVTVRVADDPPTMDAGGVLRHLVFAEHGPDGSARTTLTWGGNAIEEQPWGLGVDPAGNLVFAATSLSGKMSAGLLPDVDRLFVAKIAP
jgi:hypothetical protein